MMALAVLSVPAFAAEDDRPVTATLGGRLHLDFATFDNDNRGTPNKDDTEIRRAWVDVSGKFFVVDYKLEADFSGDRVEAKDVPGPQLRQGGQADRGPVQAVFLAG